MKLFELFDKSAQAEWVSRGEDEAIAFFNIASMEYKVNIEDWQVGNDIPAWSASFAAMGDDPTDMWTYGNTNTGHQFEVYATVMTLIQDHMKQFGVRCLYVEAKDNGRRTLYTRMIRRILRGWALHQDGDILVAVPPGVEYSE